jgi:hypothetical protein
MSNELVNINELLAAEKAKVQELKHNSGRILFRSNGILLDDRVVQDLPCVILAYLPVREYYARSYDPNKTSIPDCYAFDDVIQSKAQQALSCNECQFNQYGSAKQGNGKACKEKMRLVVASDDLTDIRSCVMPLTSTLIWRKDFLPLVNELNSKGYLLCMVKVKIKWSYDSRSQFRVEFSVLEPLDESLASKAISLLGKAKDIISNKYPEDEDEETAF